jgi:voltage-gated potassium channel Kch
MEENVSPIDRELFCCCCFVLSNMYSSVLLDATKGYSRRMCIFTLRTFPVLGCCAKSAIIVVIIIIIIIARIRRRGKSSTNEGHYHTSHQKMRGREKK